MGKIMKAAGAGLAVAMAAAAGVFYLYKKNPRARRNIKLWGLRLKHEVIEDLAQLREVNRETYHQVLDKVARRFEGLKEVNQKELSGLVVDLKEAWGHFNKEITALRKKTE
jgi:hypothetical protein